MATLIQSPSLDLFRSFESVQEFFAFEYPLSLLPPSPTTWISQFSLPPHVCGGRFAEGPAEHTHIRRYSLELEVSLLPSLF